MNFNQLPNRNKKGWAETIAGLWEITVEQAMEALEDINVKVVIYHNGYSGYFHENEMHKLNAFFVKKFGISEKMKPILSTI